MYPALKILERQAPPLKYGRHPYWRAPITPPSTSVYIPTWNWQSPHNFDEGDKVTVLDANAAYLAAIGSVDIAHSHLIHTGPVKELPDPRDVTPGYYRIVPPYWSFSGTIVHPLGDSARMHATAGMWIAAPTLILLLELEYVGHLGQLVILDSWTADVSANFRSWQAQLRCVRTECLDRIETSKNDAQRAQAKALYDAFKRGYSGALSMMLTGSKCLTRRPDWAHTVYAQHAASQWRKAWRYTFTGAPLVSMGATDEIAVLSADLHEALQRSTPPFRYDPTGRVLGALHPKNTTVIGCEVPVRAHPAGLLYDDDAEDVL